MLQKMIKYHKVRIHKKRKIDR